MSSLGYRIFSFPVNFLCGCNQNRCDKVLCWILIKSSKVWLFEVQLGYSPTIKEKAKSALDRYYLIDLRLLKLFEYILNSAGMNIWKQISFSIAYSFRFKIHEHDPFGYTYTLHNKHSAKPIYVWRFLEHNDCTFEWLQILLYSMRQVVCPRINQNLTL